MSPEKVLRKAAIRSEKEEGPEGGILVQKRGEVDDDREELRKSTPSKPINLGWKISEGEKSEKTLLTNPKRRIFPLERGVLCTRSSKVKTGIYRASRDPSKASPEVY